jgi:starvation-inducible DNA-binding protein
MATTTLFRPTKNDLTEDTRIKAIAMLEPHMLSAIDLGLQIKQAHWNVRGPNFIALHELFDKIVDAVRLNSDDIAERVVQLGGEAVGGADRVAAGSYLAKFPQHLEGERAFVEHVASLLATFAKHVRKGIDDADEMGDMVTSDLLTQIGREVDKNLWFVEAHLG